MIHEFLNKIVELSKKLLTDMELISDLDLDQEIDITFVPYDDNIQVGYIRKDCEELVEDCLFVHHLNLSYLDMEYEDVLKIEKDFHNGNI